MTANSRGRLVTLRIAGFRGFNEEYELDLNASAVLLYGPNGSGKSSVVDAVQWLLTGRLPRLEQWRLRKNDHYVANAFASPRTARVEALFDLAGQRVVVTRVGGDGASHLSVEDASGLHEGPSAEALVASHLAPGDLALEEVMQTSGLLQQDDLRQMLQTKPDARYRQLMRLLGLEALERFERTVLSRKTKAREALREAKATVDLARTEEAQARERLETAELQVARATARDEHAQRLEAAASEFTGVLALPSPGEEPIEQLLDRLSSLSSRVDVARSQFESLPRAVDPVSDAAVADALQRLANLNERLAEAEREVASATRARDAAADANDAISRLAAAAIPLLRSHDSAETAPCPVCSTSIDPRVVASALSARAAGAKSIQASDAVVEARRATLEELRSEAQLARERLRSLDARRRSLEVALAGWRQLLLSVEQLVDAGAVRPAGGWPEAPSGLEPSQPATEGSGSSDSEIASLGEWLENVHRASRRAASLLTDLLQQQTAARMTAERAASVPRLREAVSAARERREAAERAYAAAREVERVATHLADRTTANAGEIFSERFATLEPLMNDVYSRLDPHPAFTHLTFSVESYRAKGTATAMVFDEQRGVAVNPMLIFSAAQANSVVLAAFLALGWAAGRSSLPFVLLDDPLQAMDDVNVLGFSDMARYVRRERQLVLATHESRFAALLERKLSGRRVEDDLLVHHFIGWSRSGPEIESRYVAGLPTGRHVIAA